MSFVTLKITSKVNHQEHLALPKRVRLIVAVVMLTLLVCMSWMKKMETEVEFMPRYGWMDGIEKHM